MSRAHRGKQLDWTKPFKLIDSKSVFEQLDTDNNEMVININTKVDPAPAAINKKQEIIVPKIQTVRRVTQPKKFAKIQANYIRLTEDLNLPKLDSYQLNQVDHVFLQGHANKFKFNGKVILTPQFLSRAFIQLQKRAGKDPSLPRQKHWMTNFIERQYKQLTAMPNYESFTETFYNYWKNRRQQLKFPMLRQLWHPNPQQYNHLLAFKPRQKDKRNLRRNNRIAEDQIAQQMEEQFLLATKIAERIKFRQQLKLKQMQLQLNNFHNECKQYFGFPSFFAQFDVQSRIKDRQKLKRLQNDVQNVKKMQVETDQIQNIVMTTTYDEKQSIAQFLSTVVNMAETFQVNYQKIFSDKVMPNKQAPVIVGPSIEEVQAVNQKPDFMSLGLYRLNDTIYRSFNNYQDESTNFGFTKSPKDIFQYKSKELQLYFYGSDDQGQIKDLRKNIATGFKKFQQQRIIDL